MKVCFYKIIHRRLKISENSQMPLGKNGRRIHGVNYFQGFTSLKNGKRRHGVNYFYWCWLEVWSLKLLQLGRWRLWLEVAMRMRVLVFHWQLTSRVKAHFLRVRKVEIKKATTWQMTHVIKSLSYVIIVES